MTLFQHAAGHFANDGKGLGQDFIERTLAFLGGATSTNRIERVKVVNCGSASFGVFSAFLGAEFVDEFQFQGRIFLDEAQWLWLDLSAGLFLPDHSFALFVARIELFTQFRANFFLRPRSG
ncbi:hypothetical protein IPL44_03815 [Candidatus Saccharibacteria bacterium]|nr:MAG: hypothetical protein IPL44_03815 [Candidatus Saccharibacteria bacterium]